MNIQENQRPPRRSGRTRQAARRHPSTDAEPSSSFRRRNHARDVIDLTSDEPGNVDASPRRTPMRYAADASNNTEIVEADDVCPICQLLLYRPVTTSCNHTLCELCMATWADVSVASQMQIVDVDEVPVQFDPTSGLQASCPMCRTQTSATLDQNKLTRLRTTYPQTYAEREAEESAGTDDNNAGDIQTLTLSIGNKHRIVDPSPGDHNTHEWTFFVRPSRTDIIKEVHIHLHPTFRQSRIVRKRAPYEVCRLGWGFFTIEAFVILQPGYSWVSSDAVKSPDGAEKWMLPLEWSLDFAGFGGKGSMGRLRLKVMSQKNWEDTSEEEGG